MTKVKRSLYFTDWIGYFEDCFALSEPEPISVEGIKAIRDEMILIIFDENEGRDLELSFLNAIIQIDSSDAAEEKKQQLIKSAPIGSEIIYFRDELEKPLNFFRVQIDRALTDQEILAKQQKAKAKELHFKAAIRSLSPEAKVLSAMAQARFDKEKSGSGDKN